MLIYIIFLVFLTAFAVVVLPPHSNTCMYNLYVNLIVRFPIYMAEPYSQSIILNGAGTTHGLART